MFCCLCSKKKSRSTSVRSLVSPDPQPAGTTQSYTLGHPLESESSGESKDEKLQEIKAQFTEAQKRLSKPQRKSMPDTVIGYVEVPLYKADGRALKDAGESYQLEMYEI